MQRFPRSPVVAITGRPRSLLAAFLLIAVWAAGPAAAADLPGRLAAALAHPGLRGASVGALVARGDDGRVVFEHHADALLAPASNQKILTALGALSLFGPTARFTTRVYGTRPLDASGTVDALVIRAGGDPALTSEEWWRLAADLRANGLRRVQGELIVDDTYFDTEQWNPAWSGASARAFHAPVSALTANYGAFAVAVQRRPGAPPSISIDPPVPFFELVDRLTPGAGALTVTREADGSRDRVLVAGAPPSASTEPIFRSVSSPARYAAAVLRMQLAAVGITIAGSDRIGPTPPGAVELLAFEGKPLGEIVRPLMKFSNNNIAEMLVKDAGAAQFGAPGSWANGLAAIRERLIALGVPADGFQMVDGSGLAPSNRVSPRALVAALRSARASFGFGPELVAALPIAGRDGTLAHRASAARDAVRAKTGLLNSAAALSGYAEARDGTPLVFSIIANGYTGGAADVMAGLDAFAAALVR